MDRAACRGKDTEAWFASFHARESERAMWVCDHCDVRAECLALAMGAEHDGTYRFGIFGGMFPGTRTRLAAHARTLQVQV